MFFSFFLFTSGVYAFGFLFMLPQLFVNYKVSFFRRLENNSMTLGVVTLGNFSCNLSRSFVVTQVARIVAHCNMPRNEHVSQFCCCRNRCKKWKSVLLRATVAATKTLRGMFISRACYTRQRHVTTAQRNSETSFKKNCLV